MAKPRLDELEQAKLDKDGESLSGITAKEIAGRLVAEAKSAIAKVAPESPYARYDRDRLIGEAARLDIRVGALLGEEELRLVLEHQRQKLSGATVVKLADPAPPVQPAAPRAVRIRGLKSSPTNTWRVVCPGDKPRTVSVGHGQMSTMANGKIVALRNYGEKILQSLVDQGVKLIPIEDPEPED